MILLNFIIFPVDLPIQTDITAQIFHAFKAGNAKILTKEFADHVALTINKEDNYYTKFQAGLFLSDFFRSNKITGVKEIQKKLSSTTHSYLVYELKTNNSSYRVFIRLTLVNKEYKISELRIE